jgi:hypothetical protein
MRSRLLYFTLSAIAAGTLLFPRGVDTPPAEAECLLFTPAGRDRAAAQMSRARFERGRLTAELTHKLGAGPEYALAAQPAATASYTGTVDRHIFETMAAAGVKPAPKTNDYEFIRRVSLDLTGRIPTPQRLIAFAGDARPDKRARLVDELLASPEWTDRWAMYFGDLFRNNSRTDQVQRYAEGRNAFHSYLRASLAANKRYDALARELITAQGGNSWEQGELNWMLGGIVVGGPLQDVYDMTTANTAEMFLGLSHLNCLLCHDGKGHLNELSHWGRTATRMQAWQLASHYSRTELLRVRAGNEPQPYYYSIADHTPRTRTDYLLNTTTGNRPARCAGGVVPGPGAPCPSTAAVAPRYLDGSAPRGGETYRQALARAVTGDFQFARAAVNYLWAEFFGRGLVEPLDQFDPARLDPDKPPPAPWTLQPVNARLLNALAQDFIDSGYDLRALMRQLATSEAYQLSARYPGEWSPAWETLFARKLVRRLWAEEIHDAVAQSSNILPSYQGRTFGPVRWAMQLPETRDQPEGAGAVAAFLDAFLRGNRDDQQRRGDGSLVQALAMMNDPFVMNRIRANNLGGESGREPSLLMAIVGLADEFVVTNLYLAVLSRHPSQAELETGVSALRAGAGLTRTQRAENLLWSLYNKVDFLFNY